MQRKPTHGVVISGSIPLGAVGCGGVTAKFGKTATQRRPDMAMIYVKAKPDRRAYFEGRVIPQDKFIPVTDTPYIRRLIDHWGDLEVEGGGPKKGKLPGKAAAPAPSQSTRPPSVRPNSTTLANPNTPAPGTGAPKPTN